MKNRRFAHLPDLDRLDDRCLLSGLTPAQLTHAYGLDAISFGTAAGTTVTGNGAGETIALIEAYHDPTLASDLKTFDRAFQLPDPNLTVLNLAGSRTDSGWKLEESLDVEWAHAIAPGANILVVEARSESLQDLMAAVKDARNTPGVVAISMSWGMSEFRSESAYDSLFTSPNASQGITFVASSGDGGAAGGVQWPAASPNVLSVGGTTLTVTTSGNYVGESAWRDSSGGYSRYEPEPSYQQSVQSSGARSVPDVAFDANPATGVQVYESSPFSGRGSWQVVGGTSLGAPGWAAIIAIVDQGRSLQGMASLDGATQTLPQLYGLPSSDFHAVSQTGKAGSGPVVAAARIPGVPGLGRISATQGGANTVTGLGTPNGPLLVGALTNDGSTPPVVAAAVPISSPGLRIGVIPSFKAGRHWFS